MKNFYIFILFVFTQFNFGQSTDFNFELTQQPETCTGNGQINIGILNSQSSSTINFLVYQLPNITTPVTITTSLNVSSLISGNYKVVGYHNINGVDEIVEKQIEVLNEIEPLNYTFFSEQYYCENNGSIVVNIVSGNAATYQIVLGPITTAEQSSNIFNNLPSGEYEIKVKDVCGNVVVKTYQLNYIPLNLNVAFIGQTLVNENTIAPIYNLSFPETTNNLNVLPFLFPLQITIAVSSVTNTTPVLYNFVVNNLSELQAFSPYYRFSNEININPLETNNLNFSLTDNCGNNYVLNSVFEVFVNQTEVQIDLFNPNDPSGETVCNFHKFKLKIYNLTAPYLLTFNYSPASFIPTNFNSEFPGPFTSNQIDFYNNNQSVPTGDYEVQITDANGQIEVLEFKIEYPSPELISSVSVCGSKIIITNKSPIVQVLLVEAIPLNGFNLPIDYSSFITIREDVYEVVITNLPSGFYKFKVVDICGNIDYLETDLLPFQFSQVVVNNHPSCDSNKGSAILSYPHEVVFVEIIEAPASFPFALPYLITTYFGTGPLLTDLPIGTYKVKAKTICETFRTDEIQILPYNLSSYSSTIDLNCGSFDFYFSAVSNVYFDFENFYLQKFDNVTQQWVHPNTLQPQTNLIDNICALPVLNNVYNINFFVSGKFRLLQRYYYFSEAFGGNYCVKELEQFEIFESLQLNENYAASCSNNSMEIFVSAMGVEPISYKITHKNGLPFEIDNGWDGLFQNLEVANYSYQVEDNCGNIIVNSLSIDNSINLNIISNKVCLNQDVVLNVPNIPFLSYNWYHINNSTTILSTSSQLVIPYITNLNLSTYYVSVTNSLNSSSCLNTTKYINVELEELASAGNDAVFNYCGVPNEINLFGLLNSNISTSGNWNVNGNSLPIVNGLWNLNNTVFGSYLIEYKVLNSCGIEDVAQFTFNFTEKPIVTNLNTEYNFCIKDNLVLNIDNLNASFLYEWTHPNGYVTYGTELNLPNLEINQSGIYQLIIKNGDCFSDVFQFQLNVSEPVVFTITEVCVNNKKSIEINYINWNSNIQLFLNDVEINASNSVLEINTTGINSIKTNNNGCVFEKQIQIDALNCSISNLISPNNDGYNDFFDLTGLNVKNIQIFNRWGREVYYKHNYSNEWYGQANNGNNLPSGTYFYIINFMDNKTKNSWIYIAR